MKVPSVLACALTAVAAFGCVRFKIAHEIWQITCLDGRTFEANWVYVTSGTIEIEELSGSHRILPTTCEAYRPPKATQ